jgi:hypothetical protein
LIAFSHITARKLVNQVQTRANQINVISFGLTIANSRSTKSRLAV